MTNEERARKFLTVWVPGFGSHQGRGTAHRQMVKALTAHFDEAVNDLFPAVRVHEARGFLIAALYPGQDDTPAGTSNTLWAVAKQAAARIAELEAEVKACTFTENETPDEWSDAIDAAYPTRSESHEEYGIAMRMVSNRFAKSSLVALVNWLLLRIDALEVELKEAKSAEDYALGVELRFAEKITALEAQLKRGRKLLADYANSERNYQSGSPPSLAEVEAFLREAKP